MVLLEMILLLMKSDKLDLYLELWKHHLTSNLELWPPFLFAQMLKDGLINLAQQLQEFNQVFNFNQSFKIEDYLC